MTGIWQLDAAIVVGVIGLANIAFQMARENRALKRSIQKPHDRHTGPFNYKDF